MKNNMRTITELEKVSVKRLAEELLLDPSDDSNENCILEISGVAVTEEWVNEQGWYKNYADETEDTFLPTMIVRILPGNKYGADLVLGMKDGELVGWGLDTDYTAEESNYTGEHEIGEEGYLVTVTEEDKKWLAELETDLEDTNYFIV